MDRGLRYTTTIALSQRPFFRQQLRMNRATFNTVLNILGPRIVRENSRFRACLCPAKILAIGLYRLAHGNSYLTIGPAFNVGKSAVIEAVQDVVGALYELRDDQIKFLENLAEITTLIQSFEELSVLPNIVGAIDNSHVRIKAPKDSAADYFSLYQQHDFIIQAVVDGHKFSQISLVDFLEVCTMLVCYEEVGFSHKQSKWKFSPHL